MFYKIRLWQHSRILAPWQVSCSNFVIAKLLAEPFCNIPIEDSLILISLAWSRLRDARSQQGTSGR